MSDKTFANIRDWVEPAHPSVVKLYGDLVEIYRSLRERQTEIDAAFDRVAAQIGHVITTTVPVKLEVSEKGAITAATLDSAVIKGTLFDKEFGPLLKQLTEKPLGNVSAGTYRIYFVWYDALKLKLRGDWVEPAHYLQAAKNALEARGLSQIAAAVRPEVREPAHWFDPGTAIAVEDAVVISAIDEVYPELRLGERISADRLALRRIPPEVMEPAHFRDFSSAGRDRDFLVELKALISKYHG